MTRATTLTAAAAVGALTATAVGGNVLYKVNGGAVQTMGVGDFTTLADPAFSGPSGDPFDNATLTQIHTQLNGDGVVTNDALTFVAARTSAGVTMFALFDQETNVSGDSR